jgi:hypothetical protein
LLCAGGAADLGSIAWWFVARTEIADQIFVGATGEINTAIGSYDGCNFLLQR